MSSNELGRKGHRSNELPRSPKGLSSEARRWWNRLHSGYELADEAALLTLQTALEAFDRMREAQEIIRKEGMTVRDRFGQPRAHPASVVERDSRAAMMAGLKALNLDIEPLRDGPGRPGGR
jgi:P27 family predicted phage terminase small subunit